MWLGIDTSGNRPGVALVNSGDVVAEHAWLANRRQTHRVAEAVSAMLTAQRVAPGDLDGIGVGIGPGSYAGLRSGMALAKGMALAAGLALVGVPTLDSVVAPYSPPTMPRGGPLWAVLDAGRGRIVAVEYAVDGGPVPRDRWVRDADTLLALATEGSWIVGEVDPVTAGRLRAAGLHVLPNLAGSRRAAWIAELGRRAFEGSGPPYPVAAVGDLPALAALEPMYLDQER